MSIAVSKTSFLGGGLGFLSQTYVAQGAPQFDAEIAEKGHLWMETG